MKLSEKGIIIEGTCSKCNRLETLQHLLFECWYSGRIWNRLKKLYVNSNLLTLDFLKEVNDYGASRLIYTDINRDGTKQSPNFEETTIVANVSNCPVIISGGVSSMDDIKKAKGLKNIEGIIVGKAIYDGDIKLEELVRELDA